MSLTGRTYAVLVAEGVEDLEYWVTVMRLREEGATVVTVGSDTDSHKGKNGLSVKADVTADGFDPAVAYMQGKLKSTGSTGELFRLLRSGEAGEALSALASRP